MDIKQIERLMRTMRQHGVTKLELSEGETRLSLEREAAVFAASSVESMPGVLAAQGDQTEASAFESKKEIASGKEILSPMVGIFHPNVQDPVKTGARLKKGDVVCVIEAMKLMNDIAMEEDGEITYIALKDGDMVEFGQLIATYI